MKTGDVWEFIVSRANNPVSVASFGAETVHSERRRKIWMLSVAASVLLCMRTIRFAIGANAASRGIGDIGSDTPGAVHATFVDIQCRPIGSI